MISKKELWITNHAAEKMIIEGITAEQVCEALERGSRFQQTDGFLSAYGYFSVAWKKTGNLFKIKTVFVNK